MTIIAVIVAQLVDVGGLLMSESLTLTSVIHGSNPNISKILSTNCTLEKDKNKRKKWPGRAHL